ncbi:MAG: heme lyase CcmF/NrfE family subunit [Candidatus Zhuqueibacterota bacterium]
MAIGYYFLLAAFALTAYSIWAGFSGIKLNIKSLIHNAEIAIYGQFLFATVSIALLAVAFLTRDFSIRYVAEYSDRQLPLLYTISAVWAGQHGSILFWAWLLTMFNAMFVFWNRKEDFQLKPIIFTVYNIVTLFFLILVSYASNPFEKLPTPMPDGLGLNPLLQNPEMIFHPPTLFLGFVGFTVPFSFAIAALIRGDLSWDWLERSRNWTLFAWISLTIGNLLGAQWAYVELGWGGYWAWDPVENASLLPWLTGTAFVHSLMAQKSRDMMKVWNVVLIVTTFLLTILGTFITRSGIISSVHAFGKSNIGTLFLVFMGIVAAAAIFLILLRLRQLRSPKHIDNYLSRDFTFLLNNIIFSVLMIAILWGTLYPAFTELFIGKQITLGQPYFNRISVPLGIFLLMLIAICPIVTWRETSQKTLKRFIPALILSFVFAIILFALGVRNANALLTLGFAFLTLSIIFSVIINNIASNKRSQDKSLLAAIGFVMKLNTRRYSAYLIHLGVMMVYVAIVGTTVYKQEKEITLQKGETTSIGKYKLVYEKMGERNDSNKDVLTAEMSVYVDEKKVGTLVPQRFYYRSSMGQQQYTTEVAVQSNLIEDLYVSLASYQEDESATFVLMVNPLMNWMWIGGGVMAVGIIIILLHSAKNKRKQKKLLAAARPAAKPAAKPQVRRGRRRRTK